MAMSNYQIIPKNKLSWCEVPTHNHVRIAYMPTINDHSYNTHILVLIHFWAHTPPH